MNFMKNNLRQEYLKQSVMTASPAELVVILLDSCIKNVKLMDICLEGKDINGVNNHCLKAQKIILELVNCLDTSFELSTNLLSIYDFLLFSLREMNAKKDLEKLPEVLNILVSIRDTWQQISKPNCSCSSEVS